MLYLLLGMVFWGAAGDYGLLKRFNLISGILELVFWMVYWGAGYIWNFELHIWYFGWCIWYLEWCFEEQQETIGLLKRLFFIFGILELIFWMVYRGAGYIWISNCIFGIVDGVYLVLGMVFWVTAIDHCPSWKAVFYILYCIFGILDGVFDWYLGRCIEELVSKFIFCNMN